MAGPEAELADSQALPQRRLRLRVAAGRPEQPPEALVGVGDVRVVGARARAA